MHDVKFSLEILILYAPFMT